jgi:formylmethanofuran dehydrogenase subunit E
MSDFADDLIDNDFDFHPKTHLVVCLGCTETVREDQTLFENGKSCCVYCN